MPNNRTALSAHTPVGSFASGAFCSSAPITRGLPLKSAPTMTATLRLRVISPRPPPSAGPRVAVRAIADVEKLGAALSAAPLRAIGRLTRPLRRGGPGARSRQRETDRRKASQALAAAPVGNSARPARSAGLGDA